MALETGGSAEVSESAPSTSEAASSGYSATDPGYEPGTSDSSNSDGPTLEQLIADNKPQKKQPSETSDDASETESDTSGEAEGETEETVETPTAETADSTEISDELLDRAEALGYTIDEIKGFRSAKSLEKEISRVEKLTQRMQERQAKPEPEPEEKTKPEPDWDALLEAGHDPDMLAMQKETWQENQSTKALLKQLTQAEQDRAWNAQCERFDENLNKLGEEYKTILGSGRRAELLKASPEIASNREKVFAKMLVLKDGYQKLGQPVPPESELIQEAFQASFYKQAQTIARTALKIDIKKAGSQALSRPHSAGAKVLSGAPLAASKEQAFWKKFS